MTASPGVIASNARTTLTVTIPRSRSIFVTWTMPRILMSHPRYCPCAGW